MNRISDRMSGIARMGRGLALVGLTAGMAAAENIPLNVSGFAWTQGLYAPKVYQGAANFDNNSFIQAGGMGFINQKPNDNWDANLSFGVAFGNNAIKKTLKTDSGAVVGRINPHSVALGMNAFLYEANVAYKTASDAFAVKIGKFHYVYSDYNHNMGLYLLRGPVYPGFLYSGFEDIAPLTKTGFQFTYKPMSTLTLDVLPTVETDFKPFMDLNLSAFLTYKQGLFELGAGVESQRLVEFNSCITSPSGKADVDECLGGDPKTAYAGDSDLYQSAFMIIDTLGGKRDTLTYSLAGTKVMVRGALDFKAVLGEYQGSAKDWVFYFEAALLGVKDYPLIYTKKSERMPMLAGFNFPTYGLLDLASLEVEYYNAPYQNDPYKLVGAYDVFQFSDGNSINYAFSPIPPSNVKGSPHLAKAQEDFDPKKDNLKWSLMLQKKVADRITFKFQLASDHWRVPNNNFVQYEAASEPGQFYSALRVDYFLH